MRRSTDRLLTTHVGSLVRPPELIRLSAEARDDPERRPAYLEALQRETTDIIRRQVHTGIDAAHRILEMSPETVVFLCSTYARGDLPPAVATSGAAAYIHKEELTAAHAAVLDSLRGGAGSRGCERDERAEQEETPHLSNV